MEQKTKSPTTITASTFDPGGARFISGGAAFSRFIGRRIPTTLLVAAALLLGSSCWPLQVKPKASFASFSVGPGNVCTNIGLPIVRASWRVKGNKTSCVDIDINGNYANPAGDARCGEKNWENDVAINLRSIFGYNIPSSMTVNATLSAGVGPLDTDPVAHRQTTIHAIECQLGGNPD